MFISWQKELRVTRTSNRINRGVTVDEADNNIGNQPSPRQPTRINRGNTSTKSHLLHTSNSPLLQPLVMHFTAVVQVQRS